MAKKVKSLAAASSFAERAGSERSGGGGGGGGGLRVGGLGKSQHSIKADDAEPPLIITSPASALRHWTHFSGRFSELGNQDREPT